MKTGIGYRIIGFILSLVILFAVTIVSPLVSSIIATLLPISSVPSLNDEKGLYPGIVVILLISTYLFWKKSPLAIGFLSGLIFTILSLIFFAFILFGIFPFSN